ncbi:hypothetical protein J8F10_24050 [Gemmata sp. G18]|uniref:DUF6950 domain-containing protein n=1 Tax=Gemmata palustris TaxID=2822762 RepID=A0ABS5BZK6_9BACT|nr:hypothetical protein [Gemmata palustris]MBP3958333.1 hypothetical protein [Gemmata palustris]
MRTEGWESLLNEYVAASAGKEFDWGEHDCGLWSGTWVLLCTGRDFVSRWKGTYRTTRGAKLAMARLGFNGVEAVAADALEEKPVPLARRGDLVLHPQGALGICNGRVSHFVTASGLTTIDTLACTRAWGVD